MEPATWNDKRLDDLSDRVDAGFTRIDERFAQADERSGRLEAKVAAGFARVDQEMAAGFARVDQEMAAGFARVDQEMAAGFARVDQEMAAASARADIARTAGFARVDREIEHVEGSVREVRAELDVFREATGNNLSRIDARLEGLQESMNSLRNVMLGFCGTLVIALIAALVSIMFRMPL